MEEKIVNITLYDSLHIQLNTENYEYLKAIREYFTDYVPGYMHSPKYKAGVWSGKICVLDVGKRTLPYGLLTEVINFSVKEFPDIKLKVEPDVANLFKGQKIEYKWDLIWPPRPYQEECIKGAINYTKGIFRVSTSGGKTLILAYIYKNLKNANLISKALIVVPTLNLIGQFRDDWKDYGITTKIGIVNSKYKEWNKPIVVSTWQTLANNHDKINLFDCIFIDECHQSQAFQLNQILQKSNAKYKIGCTGTMPDCRLDDWNVRAYLGPIYKNFSASYLKEHGYIVPCTINIHHLHYGENFKGDFNEVKDSIFNHPGRVNFITELVKSIENQSILILVGKVETEGEFLKNHLFDHGFNREIVFLSGRDSAEVRESWRQRCRNGENIIFIATYPIFQMGVNIERLAHVVFAAPFKSKIRILQSIGRALRKHSEKTNGAQIHDLVDHNNKWFPKHSDIRLRHYNREKFQTVEKDITI